ncbi:hypothetical protein HHI36_002032, partial [Cryptolaemus montrouzieri]
TDNPEKDKIERERSVKKRLKEIKNKSNENIKTVRKMLEDSSESESSMILESDDVMTDKNSDEVNMQCAKEQFGKLTRYPIEGQVLIEFRGKKDEVYYIAKIFAVINEYYEVGS